MQIESQLKELVEDVRKDVVQFLPFINKCVEKSCEMEYSILIGFEEQVKTWLKDFEQCFMNHGKNEQLSNDDCDDIFEAIIDLLIILETVCLEITYKNRLLHDYESLQDFLKITQTLVTTLKPKAFFLHK